MGLCGERVGLLRLWWVIEELVPDGWWERVASLLSSPKPRCHRHLGRRPSGARAALAGIVVVLTTGVIWTQLPTTLVGCSGVTCWRRLRDWTEAGVWPARYELLLAQLRALGELDLDCCAVDGSPCPRPQRRGCGRPVPGRLGSTHHLLGDAGVPLAVSLTGGNRNDITQLIPLVDAIPSIRGRRGRPRRRPGELFADRGYHFDSYRRQLRACGITARIARRGVAHGSGLGCWRWTVERTIGWLHQYRRLRTRWERRADIHEGLLKLACYLICWRCLQRSFR